MVSAGSTLSSSQLHNSFRSGSFKFTCGNGILTGFSKHPPHVLRSAALTFHGKPSNRNRSGTFQLSVLVLDSIRKNESGRRRIVLSLVEQVILNSPKAALLSLVKCASEWRIIVLRAWGKTRFDMQCGLGSSNHRLLPVPSCVVRGNELLLPRVFRTGSSYGLPTQDTLLVDRIS